jgi:hypothetical protein
MPPTSAPCSRILRAPWSCRATKHRTWQHGFAPFYPHRAAQAAWLI